MTDPAARVRIGVDGYNLAQLQGTGVATFGRSLCAALKASSHPLDLIYGVQVASGSAPEQRETLFFDRLAAGATQPKQTLRRRLKRAWISPGGRKLVFVPRTGRVIAPELDPLLPASDRLFTRGALWDTSARYFRRYGRFLTVTMPDPPAIMHWTYPVPIKLAGAANVYTIHDLVPLRLPQTSLEDKAYYERLLRTCVAESAHICTVSETSRSDILTLLGADPAHVTSIGQPVHVEGAAPLGGELLAVWLERLFDLRRGQYLLFFGAIEPKKNVGRLIQAYLEAGLGMPLVIVGKSAWRAESELRLLDGGHGTALAGVGRIRRIDHLPRSLLLRLVEGARAVAFPSLYEGFGLPMAEAMAMGVPVLTSDRGGSAEVAGDAALKVDPYDTAEIATALRRLVEDDGLCAELSAAGAQRMTLFSAQRFSAWLEEVHARVLPARG
jgi:glycosyltransferase involved in cell wall biosynthesis